jgi:hypothetical protein
MPEINAKEVAGIAANYLQELVPGVTSLQLEEVERDEDGWCVTLSYILPDNKNPFVPLQHQRSYKDFRVDAISGEVESMKIRTV